MKDIKKHPSGRPIHKEEKKGMPIFRSPGIGPCLPRRQQAEPKDAIGFHRFIVKDDGFE